ncbi:uncharacterized protein LOC124449142 [Xenia sp. Carnegie-2017]|uniref:uncharacterized protein LOC124449142 n=1 Tax=Xenia sp. Carnegie-2017 TaxID=2897299 RepID=UPI001F0386A7|nr:uncharacterized protein LOC124449142 [Xenia sp. Carnegie-2017]
MLSFPIRGPVCMKFFFYLHGRETGFLEILKKRQSSSAKVIWSRYGNHGRKWNLGQVFIDFSLNIEYKIIVSGKIGNSRVWPSIAIDKIKFENERCVSLPTVHNEFNCPFKTENCGWSIQGPKRVVFNKVLGQYTLKTFGKRVTYLRSPTINRKKACFTFQYYAHRYNMGLMVLIKDKRSRKLLPFWMTNGYHDIRKWNNVKILLKYKNGFDQVVIRRWRPYTAVSFANFALINGAGSCKTRNTSHIGKCQPDQIEIMNKCMWFECSRIYSLSMKDYCSQNFGALASFNEKSFENMTKYLRDIDADSSRKTDITIGLSKNKNKWFWQDGRLYNNEMGWVRNSRYGERGAIVWDSAKNKWSIGSGRSWLHLCESKSGKMFIKQQEQRLNKLKELIPTTVSDILLSTIQTIAEKILRHNTKEKKHQKLERLKRTKTRT